MSFGGDFFGELNDIASHVVTASFKLTAAFVRTAAISVAQGHDSQGAHMLINMNGREYVLRGADADTFRREYAAIPKPQVQVNTLVEKYLGKMQPYNKPTIQHPPAAPQQPADRRRQDAEGLADSDAYWGGKEKGPNDYKRYMQTSSYVGKVAYVSHCPGHHNSEGDLAEWCVRQHNTDKILTSYSTEQKAKDGLRNMESHKGSDKRAEIMMPPDHKNKGQAPEFEALTGSWSNADNEFSDIGGTPRLDNLRTADAAFEEGDLVIGKLPSGAEFKGEVAAISGDKVTIENSKGMKREFPIASVTSQADADRRVDEGKRRMQQEDAERAQQEKQNKKDDRIENSVSVSHPQGSPGQLAAALQRVGYDLFLTYRDTAHLERAAEEYSNWTGGEDMPEEFAYQHATAYVDEWHLVYKDKEGFTQQYGFFDVVPSGATGSEWKKGPPQGYSTRDKISIQRREIIEPLVRAGLRMQKRGGEMAELRTEDQMAQHASANKKACDPCQCEPEEVVLPAAGEVFGKGEQALPPAQVPEKEAATPGMRPGGDKPRSFNIGELTALPNGSTANFGQYNVTRIAPKVFQVKDEKGTQVMQGDAQQVMKLIPQVQNPAFASADKKEAGFNLFFPGQVMKEFYPEMLHEQVDYPNDTNSPMIEDIDLDNAMQPQSILGYVSTSPAGGIGIGRDGKPQVLDGAPLRKENDIRGGMFLDEFHQQYEGIPGALMTVASKVAAKDEKAQFEKFLQLVCGEIAAAFVAAFKVTARPILGKVPGIGEVQLAQVEQPSSLSSFNIVNTGSRVKYLLDKLNDGDVKEAINKARAQAAVWLDDPAGGFVYEVFVRAESIDTDTMIMKYTFITGTKDSE